MYEILTKFVCPNAVYSIPQSDDAAGGSNRIGVNVLRNGEKYKSFRSIYSVAVEIGIATNTVAKHMQRRLPYVKDNITWIFERIDNAHTRTKTSP